MNLATLKLTWAAFQQSKGTRLTAAIAYTAIVSIVPLFIVLIAVGGSVVGLTNGGHGHHLVENALLAQVSHGAGPQAAETVRQIVAASFDKPRQNVWSQVIGWIAFIAGAIGLFSAIQDSLNTIWQVEDKKRTWTQLLRERASSFAMILGLGALLLLTLVANSALAFAHAHFLSRLQVLGSPLTIGLLTQIVAVSVAATAFSLTFKILPDIDNKWRDAWIGGAVTGVLFVFGQALIAWYFAVAGIASAYGAAGSVLVALIWMYYSAMIFLIGASFTKARATQSDDDASRRHSINLAHDAH